MVAHLRAGPFRRAAAGHGRTLLGRPRACRTAQATAAAGVLCLAFPLQPARRRASGAQAPSRLPELDAVGVPVLVVQGARDPFGMPPDGPGRTVVQVAADHSLRGDLSAVRAAIAPWLADLLAP